MPNWKKVILSGSDAALNDITSSGNISSSGDIYADNFYGNFEGIIDSASHAVNVKITELNTPGNFPIIYNTGDDLLKSDPGTQIFTFNAGTGNVTAATFTGTSSHAAFAESSSHTTFAETIDIVNTPTNASVHSVLFTLNDSVKTDSTAFTYQPSTDKLSITNINATDVTGSNFTGETIKISPQGATNFFEVDSTAGGGFAILGDQNANGNETIFEVNDESEEITFKFFSTTHSFNSGGLTIDGSIIDVTDITASGDISASDVYSSQLIFPNTNGKITTPDGQSNDDYITINGTDRYFETRLDNNSLFKVDFTNELITLNESTQLGFNSNDTHTFTGNITASNNISASGTIIGSNLSGTNTGDQDLSGYALTSAIPTNNNELTNGAGYITGYTVTSGDVTAHQGDIDHDQLTNFSADEHFTQANITTVGTVTSGDISAILPAGTVSGSSSTLLLNPNLESNPLDHAIIYPQSGNMSVTDALDQTRTIGKDLKYGETEKGTILISSSFGGTGNAFITTPAQNVYIPFFKTPIKNSQVSFDWTITAINDDDEIFATAKFSNRGSFGNGHTEWYSGSLIATNNVDFNIAEGVNLLDLDSTGAVPSTVFSPNDGIFEIGSNVSAGNHYLFNHKVDMIQDPIIHRRLYAHTSTWTNSSYFYWQSYNVQVYPFDVDNLLRRFKWAGPYNIDGEDHLYFRWENNASLQSDNELGWRGVRLIIHIDYEVSNYRL